jgi:acetyl esterase/lipase
MDRPVKPTRRAGLASALIAAALLTAAPGQAQSAPAPRVDLDGTVHADGVAVPPSAFMSPEARAALAARLTAPPVAIGAGADFVKTARANSDVAAKAVIAKWLAIYPARIDSVTMGGVRTDVVVPVAGIAPENRHRVLISLHGGGFFAGARSGGQEEALPVAGRGRIEVVAVDYRLAPENKFPAASEDVERVYRALLKDYRPDNIGIYGCSAGGALVAQSVARFQHVGLPAPGAVGIFCSGAMPSFWYDGDSFATTPMMNARPQSTMAAVRNAPGGLYLAGADEKDPLVTPGLFPEVLAKFPPTLMVTGTRDTSMSNAIVTNARLLAAGVETQLFVQEGLGHGEFTLIPGTPEATQAYDVIWRFFDRHLAK